MLPRGLPYAGRLPERCVECAALRDVHCLETADLSNDQFAVQKNGALKKKGLDKANIA